MKMLMTGLDILERSWPKQLNGSRAGLVTNPASVNRRLEHAADIAMKSKKFKLKVLFGPQHGIRGETQDNMVEWKGFLDKKTGLPVYSLYGQTRKPAPEMLKDIDVLIFDIQDVGSRYYTFIWTMELCMQACLENGKSFVILDRPNPIGGHITEGTVLDMEYASFVGQRPLPIRHGMTVGEIGNYLKNEFYQNLELYIIKMKNWKRNMWFDMTKLPWVMPSPNMPTLDTATVYPGMCLLEGTNLSEGRGTTKPFEIFGAPFIEPDALVKRLNGFKLPGVFFRPLYFQPTFQKHAGKLCGGAQIHITSRERFKPFKTGVAVLKAAHDLYPKDFNWKEPPYEYETRKLPIDILAGTDRLRKGIADGEDLEQMEKWWKKECLHFNRTTRKKYLIYE
ncbi:MAG: hypothetical protein A2073_00600 [Deltaproteobacteria bacterium GWC2_42_11]|nr:MAG: hypothetical protein A2073_00600 [Deltaproteobacteria bacterium GWC2_42_11]